MTRLHCAWHWWGSRGELSCRGHGHVLWGWRSVEKAEKAEKAAGQQCEKRSDMYSKVCVQIQHRQRMGWGRGGYRWKRGKGGNTYRGLKVREKFGDRDGEENDLLWLLPASMG